MKAKRVVTSSRKKRHFRPAQILLLILIALCIINLLVDNITVVNAAPGFSKYYKKKLNGKVVKRAATTVKKKIAKISKVRPATPLKGKAKTEPAKSEPAKSEPAKSD